MKHAIWLALFFHGISTAATVSLTWVNPTQYVDGTALAASAITRTRIEYGSCSGTAFGVKAGEFIVNGNGTSGTSPNLAPGTYCFRAYTTASGVESAASNAAQKIIVQPAPEPPVLSVVSAFNGLDYAPAFGITASGARSSVLAGLVPKGTACIGSPVWSYQGHAYAEVDRATVVRKVGASLPARVAAPCA